MGKEGFMHRDFPNREGLAKSLLRVTECGHEEKTQTRILYSLALSGFGVCRVERLNTLVVPSHEERKDAILVRSVVVTHDHREENREELACARPP
jgi:hypothetical protein